MRPTRATGTVTIGRDLITFTAPTLRWEATTIESLHYGSAGNDLVNQWIEMTLVTTEGRSRTVYLCDGGWFGYHGITGTNRKMLDALRHHMKLGGAPDEDAEGDEVRTSLTPRDRTEASRSFWSRLWFDSRLRALLAFVVLAAVALTGVFGSPVIAVVIVLGGPALVLARGEFARHRERGT